MDLTENCKMKVRIETADLLVFNSYKRNYEKKSVRVGIHPDNKDFGTQVQECNSALDNTIYYWFSESEFEWLVDELEFELSYHADNSENQELSKGGA